MNLAHHGAFRRQVPGLSLPDISNNADVVKSFFEFF